MAQADFDENVNVMQFAEMASEVHIERIDPIPRELRLTPGQKKAKEAIQEALRKASSKTDLTLGQAGMNPVYSLGPSWPNVEVRHFLMFFEVCENLINYCYVQATTAIVEKTVRAFYSTIAVVCCMERSMYLHRHLIAVIERL